MPRGRFDEQRAWDRYYERLEERCDCWYTPEEGHIVCRWCAERATPADAPAESLAAAPVAVPQVRPPVEDPDEAHIKFIRTKLHTIESAYGTDAKVQQTEILMEYLLANCSFLYKHVKFCKAVAVKVQQLKAEPSANRILPLLGRVEQVVAAIQGLQGIPATAGPVPPEGPMAAAPSLGSPVPTSAQSPAQR